MSMDIHFLTCSSPTSSQKLHDVNSVHTYHPMVNGSTHADPYLWFDVTGPQAPPLGGFGYGQLSCMIFSCDLKNVSGLDSVCEAA